MTELPQDSVAPPPESPNAQGRIALFARARWLPFVLPLAVFLLLGGLEATPATDESPEKPGGAAIGLAIPYSAYPLVYTLKIALTVAAILFVLPVYRTFPLRVSPLAVLVGAVGVVVWVGLCWLDLERQFLVPLLEPIGLGGLIAAGTRSGFNPLVELADNPAWAWAFLAIRFFGLAAVVPVAEEFFYRGFVMRFVQQANWWEVPQGKVTAAAVVLATLLPMAAHPGELLAAAAWFSLITWLYVRTRNIWDCVAAHAVTNLLLGVYVVSTGEWQLM
jgi:CAAX prenyl protease-like protein